MERVNDKILTFNLEKNRPRTATMWVKLDHRKDAGMITLELNQFLFDLNKENSIQPRMTIIQSLLKFVRKYTRPKNEPADDEMYGPRLKNKHYDKLALTIIIIPCKAEGAMITWETGPYAIRMVWGWYVNFEKTDSSITGKAVKGSKLYDLLERKFEELNTPKKKKKK